MFLKFLHLIKIMCGLRGFFLNVFIVVVVVQNYCQIVEDNGRRLLSYKLLRDLLFFLNTHMSKSRRAEQVKGKRVEREGGLKSKEWAVITLH